MNEHELKLIKQQLLIDKNSLDKECVEFASIFDKVAEKVADAINIRDAAKEQISIIDAQISEAIRRDFESKGEKLTEARLSQLVLLDYRHLEVFNNWLRQKLDAEYWVAKKDAFSNKASMLKELCSLYIAGYFSDITVKGGKNDLEEKQYKQNKEIINKKRIKNNN